MLLLALPGAFLEAAPPRARAALEPLRRDDLLSPALRAEVEVVREQLLALRDTFVPRAHCAAG